MYAVHSQGYTSFDGADHYGPAEDLFGLLVERLRSENADGNFELQALTKWCPQPGPITRAMADVAVQKSLKRMKVSKLDSLQIHWWDYSMRREMLQCMHHVNDIRKEGKIDNIALTNFDTEHVALFVSEGIPIASNQVQFSLIDSRPRQKMAPFCTRNGIALLTYGTLAGGLLTDAWLGKPEPVARSDLPTPSLGKYFNMVRQWGGWGLLQELLRTLRLIADRHSGEGMPPVSIANIAVKWVLDQPGVGGVIVGLRAGLSDHADDNRRALDLVLTDDDRADIEAVLSRGNDLMEVIGDCGDEYRR
jgi:aryl-alcohol dehydrogenase-like predicted oxidoreductase